MKYGYKEKLPKAWAEFDSQRDPNADIDKQNPDNLSTHEKRLSNEEVINYS
jgi:hypothetical protein